MDVRAMWKGANGKHEADGSGGGHRAIVVAFQLFATGGHQVVMCQTLQVYGIVV